MKFSIKEAVLAGWRIFKAHPWLFIGSSLVYLAAQLVLGFLQNMTPDLISFILSVVLGTLISLGFVSFYLKAHDDAAGTKLSDLWNPKPFLQYLVASICIGVLTLIGFILLIVPGIIIALALSFTLYLVIEKRMGAFDALKESVRITRGNRLSLFLFGLVLAVMNVIGAGLLLIGLFVTVPISMLASIHVYRLLAARAGAPAAPEAVVSAPEAPAPAA